MIKSRTLTEEQLEAFAKEYPDADNRELAKKYNIKYSHVTPLASRLKVKKSEEHYRKSYTKSKVKNGHPLAYDQETIKKFKELYPTTKTDELALIFECSTNIIIKYKGVYGLKKSPDHMRKMLLKTHEAKKDIVINDTYDRKLQFAKDLGFRNLGSCIAKLGLKEFELKFKQL